MNHEQILTTKSGSKEMNISKPLYEKLPLIYMSSSIGLLFYASDLIGILSSFILFCAGCTIAVMRSNYRRQTRAKKTIQGIKLPFIIYEFYPYAFFGIAAILVRFWLQPATIGAAIILVMFAMKTLLLRRQHRFNKIKFNSVKS